MLQFWTARKVSLREVNESYRRTLSPEELGTLGKLDLFLMNEMVLASEHVDTNYVQDLATGFPATGALYDGGLGEQIPGGRRVHNTPGLGGPTTLLN